MGENGDDSPVVSATGTPLPEATAAFAALGNETRLGILFALWDAYTPGEEEVSLSFSELRERVGIRQGAQFNYHLDKLVGRFVEKTAAGYTLRRTGLLLVQSIIAGTSFADPTFDRTKIDAPCPRCGAPTAITYENVYVYRVCTECPGDTDVGGDQPRGALTAWTFEPTGLADRTAPDVFAASTIKTFARIALRFEDICPECSGRVEWSMEVCTDHTSPDDGVCPACGRVQEILVRERCSVCKSAGRGTPSIKVLFHPAVVSFCYDHGIEVGFSGATDYRDVIRTLELVEACEETVVATDPPRVRVTVSLDGDELGLVVDDEMTVREVHDSRDVAAG